MQCVYMIHASYISKQITFASNHMQLKQEEDNILKIEIKVCKINTMYMCVKKPSGGGNIK